MKKIKLITAIVSSALLSGASAAVTLTHYYSLGETAGLPTDSVGSSDFTTATGTAPTSQVGAADASIGSTHYLTYTGGSSSTGADFSALPTNNFAVGLWVRTSTISPSRSDVIMFQGNSAGGGDADLILSDGGSGATDAWAASVSGATWVGPNRGVGGSAVIDTWEHLAWVRDNGVDTLYIGGVAQTPTKTNAVSWGASGFLGTNNSGTAMDLDDLRIYTFDAGEGGDAVSAMFTAVPEPSSAALLGIGGIALLLRRRK